MRLATTFLVGVIAVSAALGAYGWAIAPPGKAEAAAPASSGMAQLAAFRCFKPDRKVVLVRGVEDGFSPAGQEPIFIRPERSQPLLVSTTQGASYDQTREDLAFTDSILAPARVTRGLFAIGMRPLGGAENDGLLIGDLTDLRNTDQKRPRFRAFIGDLAAQPGWRREGAVWSARLEDIPFNTAQKPERGAPRDLLEYLRGASSSLWIDVILTDDTSVDFVGLALCLAPETDRGMTLSLADGQSRMPPGLVLLSCYAYRDDQPVCDPYVGDTPCDKPRPVACIRPREAPFPVRLKAGMSTPSWSGGAVKTAPATPGNRFRTAGEVDAYCRAHLGAGFRVATLQDGMRDNSITGYGRAEDFPTPVWVDVPDQPSANCWNRP